VLNHTCIDQADCDHCKCRRLDLSGLAHILHPSDMTRVYSALADRTDALTNLTSLDLPCSEAAPWTAEWITRLTSLKLLKCCDSQAHKDPSSWPLCPGVLQGLTRLQCLETRLVKDSMVALLANLSQLRSIQASFGKDGSAPSCAAVTQMLAGCTQLTQLHFTFAQAFSPDAKLLRALGQQAELQDLQVNSFELNQLPEHALCPLSGLRELADLELSALHLLWLRCVT
jgi:hypothetical protein